MRFKKMRWFQNDEHPNTYYAKPLDDLKPGLGIGYRIWQQPNGMWFWMSDNSTNYRCGNLESGKKEAQQDWDKRFNHFLDSYVEVIGLNHGK